MTTPSWSPTRRRCATRSSTGDELLAHAAETGLRISDIVMANEMAWHTEDHVRAGLLRIWSVMQECIQAGINTTTVCCPAGSRCVAAPRSWPQSSPPQRVRVIR